MADEHYTPSDFELALASIKKAEGTGPTDRQTGFFLPYKDSLGFDTIGFGHLLSRGISDAAAEQILSEDLAVSFAEAQAQDWWGVVSGNSARARACVEILFNLGLSKFNGFHNALDYLRRGDFVNAGNEFANSRWAKQVGARADRLVNMIKTGAD